MTRNLEDQLWNCIDTFIRIDADDSSVDRSQSLGKGARLASLLILSHSFLNVEKMLAKLFLSSNSFSETKLGKTHKVILVPRTLGSGVPGAHRKRDNPRGRRVFDKPLEV